MYAWQRVWNAVIIRRKMGGKGGDAVVHLYGGREGDGRGGERRDGDCFYDRARRIYGLRIERGGMCSQHILASASAKNYPRER